MRPAIFRVYKNALLAFPGESLESEFRVRYTFRVDFSSFKAIECLAKTTTDFVASRLQIVSTLKLILFCRSKSRARPIIAPVLRVHPRFGVWTQVKGITQYL